MTTYESEIKIIDRTQEESYNLLNDLNNLQKYRHVSLTGDKSIDSYIDKMEISSDEISMHAPGLGEVTFKIIERTPHKTIKFETVNSPVTANAWIQLLPFEEEKSKMKITIKLQLPGMLRMMLGNKLNKGVNMIADTIANTLSNSSGITI